MATEPGAGLAGIIAGHTAIATVGKEGKGLTYRGYSIHDLAEHSTFEEVAYLLIYGHLPKQVELDEYKVKLRGMRGLPAPLKTVLELIPRSTHPMGMLCAPAARCSARWSPKAPATTKSPSPTA